LKLYHWNRFYEGFYAPAHVIVVAENYELAREKAVETLKNDRYGEHHIDRLLGSEPDIYPIEDSPGIYVEPVE
jgi:hypothetical protein